MEPALNHNAAAGRPAAPNVIEATKEAEQI
jgi:hypothetical protein